MSETTQIPADICPKCGGAEAGVGQFGMECCATCRNKNGSMVLMMPFWTVSPPEKETWLVEALGAIADTSTWKYERWLYDAARGEDHEGMYCVDCVVIQRYVERHNKTGCTSIDGWNEWVESDGYRFCDRCGCVLWHSLTGYGVENEMEYLATEGDPLGSVVDVTLTHHMLTCGGEYEFNRKNWWPVLEPLCDKLIAACDRLREVTR